MSAGVKAAPKGGGIPARSPVRRIRHRTRRRLSARSSCGAEVQQSLACLVDYNRVLLDVIVGPVVERPNELNAPYGYERIRGMTPLTL
jgi:hypothetical protein